MVFFLTQNMASSQYIQERIKIQKEDGEKKKKKEDVKVFSLPFQWKLQSIPEASWQILSLPPTNSKKNHHWIRWPTVLSFNLTHSVTLWTINYWKCLQWSNNLIFFFLVKNPKQNIPQTHGVSTQNCCLLWGYLYLLQNYELYKGKFRNYHIPYPVPHLPLTSESCKLHLFLL